MPDSSGCLYLNDGNAWPSAALGSTVQVSGGVLSLAPFGAGLAKSGAFLIGPLQVAGRPTAWFQVRATLAGASTPGEAHFQFLTYTSPGPAAPWNPALEQPFADAGWKAAPRDALDFTIANPPNLKLFLGCTLRGDGQTTPAIQQIRIDYGRDTYAKFLPPVYRAGAAASDFLERFLGMNGSVLGGIESEIEDLPLLFDAWAAPAGEPPSWLGWLSGWLAFIQDEHWSEDQARLFLSQAFELYEMRGTLEGLRRYLRMYAGMEVHIGEPARDVRLWSLGERGTLGFSTMLAPGPLEGAVLGSTAVVDQSHMTTGENLGAALYEDVAHRFCVHVYCSELTRPGALETVRAVIEREKPAHTAYELCVIEPAMRVGVQARIGFDTIVAAGPPPAGTGIQLNAGALGNRPELCKQLPEIERKTPWQL
jgi:phage tail-like protein